MYTIAALSYINAIFLTTYPTSYLAYFYLAFAILFICTSQLTGTHLTHHYKKTLTVMLFICIFLLLGNWHFSTHFQIGSWWPFFFCTFLMMSNKFLMHNYWNGISQLLEIRDFKHYSNYFSGSSALAGVMMGYFLPYFIKGHSIFILLPIMAAFLTINLILLQLIKIEEAVEEDAPSGKSFTYQYKLQKLLFPFLICTLVFSTLVDYIFKYQIKLSLDSTQIAIYTSEMTALSNIIVFCMQLFFTRMVLKRFGLFGFILQVPILLTVLILLVLSHPSLMTITILMVGYNVINFSILDVSFQLLGNALPTHVRIMTKLHLRGMTLFLGALISAGLITLLANQATPTIIALFLLAVAGAFALLAKWISMAYNDTLENDLEKHHIIHNEDSYLTENIRYWHELIDKCFSSEEDAVRLMGYELLAEKKYPITLDILEKVVLDLKTQNPIIRIEAIKQLQQHMNKKMFKVLKKASVNRSG